MIITSVWVSGALEGKPEPHNYDPGKWDRARGIGNQESGTENQEPESGNQESGTRYREQGTRNEKPGTNLMLIPNYINKPLMIILQLLHHLAQNAKLLFKDRGYLSYPKIKKKYLQDE